MWENSAILFSSQRRLYFVKFLQCFPNKFSLCPIYSSVFFYLKIYTPIFLMNKESWSSQIIHCTKLCYHGALFVSWFGVWTPLQLFFLQHFWHIAGQTCKCSHGRCNFGHFDGWICKQISFFVILNAILSEIFQLLYVPCMFCIRLHLSNSCYKIMFVLGVLDMVNLLMFAALNGFLTIIGAVYCSSPGFLYLKGSLSAGANAFLDFKEFMASFCFYYICRRNIRRFLGI